MRLGFLIGLDVEGVGQALRAKSSITWTNTTSKQTSNLALEGDGLVSRGR